MASSTTIAAIQTLPFSRERGLRIAAWVFGSAAIGVLLAALAVALWARHSFTPVEAMVALHTNMLASGEGLYYPANQYPFTVSPYGPIFYALSAGLHMAGLPLYMGARLISFLSMGAAAFLSWRILGLLHVDAASRLAGLLLALSTTTLVFWGTIGQVDMLAIALSLAAFERFLSWRIAPRDGKLLAAGALIVLSVFTKQTAVSAGAAIAISLLLAHRSAAFKWILGVGMAGLGIALALNSVTGGAWVENAIYANINPFEWPKLELHVRYYVLTSCGVLAIALAGLRCGSRERLPLYLFTLLATLVWLVTAPKAGSDLNYQIEMTLLWILCAASALDALSFFPKVMAGDRSWVTLLQVPLALHLVLNLVVSAKSLAERVVVEPERREAIARLAPYLSADRSRVIVSDYDALVQLRGRTDLETLIYSILAQAGRMDTSRVVSDLKEGRIDAVVVWGDLFAPDRPAPKSAEALGLPPEIEQAIRARYRFRATIPEPFFGPYYIYEPSPQRTTTDEPVTDRNLH